MNLYISSLCINGVVLTCEVVLRPRFCGSPIRDKEQRQSTDISCILFFIFRGKDFSLLLHCKQIIKGNYPFVGGRHWFMAQKAFLDDEREQGVTQAVGLTNPAQLSRRSNDTPILFVVCLRVRGERDQAVSCEQGRC